MNAEVSRLPNGWVAASFEEAIEVVSDRGLRIKQKTYLEFGKLPIVDQGDGLIGGYTNDASARVDHAPPVIVFGDHTRRFKYVTFPFAVGADGVKVFAPSDLFLPKFLFLQLGTIDLEDRGYGRHYQHLRKETLLVPPRAEQTRIVEKLEELLSDLEAGVAELKAAQRKLAQYRQSLLKAAVEGALTADWRAARVLSGEPQETGADLLQRILTERRARWEEWQLAKFSEQGAKPPKDWRRKYAEPETPAANGQLSIPLQWAWAGIEQVAEGTRHALKAGPFGSALKKEFYTPEGYKIYGQEQVIRGDAHFGDYFVSQEKFDELSACAVKPGDLLVSLVGTTGKILVLPDDAKPGIINPRLLKVSLALESVVPTYIRLVLESPYARHFFKLNAHGGTMDVLNLGILKELAIPIPPVTEQHEIVRRIGAASDAIECQATAIEHALKQAAAQRKNVLKAAFAGQLVPQNPSDEPASALLERIRVERTLQSSVKNGGRASNKERKHHDRVE